MKRASIAVLALAALLLTGCAGAADDADAEPDTIATVTQDVETPEPLVAETPDAASADDADAAFLAYVRENLPPKTTIANATDAQLLTAGGEACERLGAGEPSDQIVVVEGEQPWENGTYYDSATIITGARLSLCPA